MQVHPNNESETFCTLHDGTLSPLNEKWAKWSIYLDYVISMCKLDHHYYCLWLPWHEK
jgi:hypothetical protein